MLSMFQSLSLLSFFLKRLNLFVVLSGNFLQSSQNRTGTGRNQTTDDNVFFQALQAVNLALDRSFGKNAGRLLERCGRDKRLGLQRSFGNTKQNRIGSCRRFAVGNNLGIFRFKDISVNLLAYQEGRIARSEDFNLAQHLRNNNFDMLVVNLNTLQTVNVLNFLNQIFSKFLNAENSQNIMRSRCSFYQRVTLLDDIPILNGQMTAFRNQIFNRLTLGRNDGNSLLGLIVLAKLNHTVNIRDDCRIFRTAGFKQLGNTRQTTGNILGL